MQNVVPRPSLVRAVVSAIVAALIFAAPWIVSVLAGVGLLAMLWWLL